MTVVLVGNKADRDTYREVQEAEATAAAYTRNCTFIETSAKGNTNVESMFVELLGMFIT